MKDNSWEDELLDEILGETGAPAVRAGSLDQMLGAVRQRRRGQRRRIQLIVAAFCVLGSLGLLMRFLPKQHLAHLTPAEPLLVHSQPLSPGTIVQTAPLLIGTVNSSASPIALVEKLPPGDLFETIGDDTLLALLNGRPAALVHPAFGGAELVFLNPQDSEGFQIP